MGMGLEAFGGGVGECVGGRVGDVVHLFDDELDGLAALLGVAVDLVGHEAFQVVDERHVAHVYLGLLPQQRLARIVRMH